MPTFHRRDGSVKYVAPRRLLEGFRPAVAIPATLFAAVVVGAIAFALHKTPVEQKWLILRDEPSWLPALSDAGRPLRADGHFLFEGALDRARTPTATRRSGAIPLPGEAAAPAAGRVALSAGSRVIVEHALDSGGVRRFVRTTVGGVEHRNAGVGAIVQRGERLAEGENLEVDIDIDAEIGSLPEGGSAAALEIRSLAEDALDAPAFELGR